MYYEIIMMQRTGIADLRLCEGQVPMYKEMVKLAKPIIKFILNEFGESEVIKRFSDPFWFQCLACALGFEYNYTGATTVTIRAIKEAINNENLPIKVLGGKGKEAINIQKEIEKLSEIFNFKEKTIERLKESSKLSAKVDNSLIQDSYDIYFHSIIINEKGEFSIINQGMNVREKMVRRYHWYSPTSFFDNPHSGITISNKIVLNLADKKSKETRKAILDLVKDYPLERLRLKILNLSKVINSTNQKRLIDYLGIEKEIVQLPYYLKFPRKINEKALKIAKEAENFKEFLMIKGIGPSTIRALAFLSALIYGTELSWKDPQIYCYAHGTKAGRPWFVEKKLMIENARILEEILKDKDFENKRKVLIRLSKIVERYTKDI